MASIRRRKALHIPSRNGHGAVASSYYPELANGAACVVVPTEHLGAVHHWRSIALLTVTSACSCGLPLPAPPASRHLQIPPPKRHARIHDHVAATSCAHTATLVSVPAAGRRSCNGVQSPADSAGLASYPPSSTVTRARAPPIEQSADATRPSKAHLEVHFARIRANGSTHIDQNDADPAEHRVLARAVCTAPHRN
ncbi:hypothetical protein AURDEDRAFT_165984 [Auricularia subglabra TFB-10046 SS5]|nr:hypothetical protein AURDEDRAFT_165984 [Auricularia subglabra TFB-10046 SS5]